MKSKYFLSTVLFLLSFSYSFGQSPLEYDTTFNSLGMFNGSVYATLVQPNGKIIISGEFTEHRYWPLNHIGRFTSDFLSQDYTTPLSIGTGANNIIFSTALQSDGKIVIGGWFTNFNGTPINRIARLNTNGSLDMTFTVGSGVNGEVRSIAIQTDGKIVIGGTFTQVNGINRNNIARLNADGTLDNTFDPGTGTGINGGIRSVALQTDGKIIIGGFFTTYNGLPQNNIARLNANGTIDNTLNVGTGTDFGVTSIAIQSDGKILIGGVFSFYNGTGKNRIVRLNTDGSNDAGFTIGTGFNGDINAIKIQTDGKILVGGLFDTYNGNASFKLCRLTSSGAFDASLNAGVIAGGVNCISILSDGSIIIGGDFNSVQNYPQHKISKLAQNGTIQLVGSIFGTNKPVYAMALQTEDKLIIGGEFKGYNNSLTNYLSRLNLNAYAALDATFNSGTGPNNTVKAIAIQPDGKIIIGGLFSSYNGVPINAIARLNPDGSLDNTFTTGSGANSEVRSISLQPDGKILIAGLFTMYNGSSSKYLARLNSDGTLDNSFVVGTGANNWITCITTQKNGKIIIAGYFTNYNGQAINRIARLNGNGSLDNTFLSGQGANSYINTLVIEPGDKILVGGNFTTFNAKPKNYLVRLHEDGSIDNGFLIGTGPNSQITSILLQSDFKIIVNGYFSAFNGVNVNNTIRLYSNGATDIAYNYTYKPNGPQIYTGLIQKNGRIIFGGLFDHFFGRISQNIIRVMGDKGSNVIIGTVYTDANTDCTPQPAEKKLSSQLVKSLPGPNFASTNALGEYVLKIDTGNSTNTISLDPNAINAKLLTNQCTPSHTISFTGNEGDTCCINFANDIKQCSLLKLSLQKSRTRRCFPSPTFVSYTNYGNLSASNGTITIEYPPYIIPLSSTPPWTSKSGNVLTYTLGTIPAFESGNITIIDSVICGDESIRGLTQCIQATISPASTCVTTNPAWDKSSIKVTGSCINGIATFTIKNVGSGNMLGSHEYRVYVNDTLIYKSTFTLAAGEYFTVEYPANGNTIRVEADQHPLHPGKSKPRASVENCGTPISQTPTLGIINNTTQDDLDEETAISCNEIRDSYDPNDKLASPAGIGAFNQVAPNEVIHYTIRFQNTGTDTAYHVRIIDTLDVPLDPTGLIEGVSSHPYKLSVSGKGYAILDFQFDNINLPDSTTNKIKSNGLVNFEIPIAASTPLGTTIKNKAYIFFDYNSAIITNETSHKVDVTVEEDLTKGVNVVIGNTTSVRTPNDSPENISVYPNPSTGILTIDSKNPKPNTKMIIYNLLGVPLKTITLPDGNLTQIEVSDLPHGSYVYEFIHETGKLSSGLLQIR